ncbi:hypothetical protein N7516_006578 [Penicillium verrucosum]|uniref:uncharacterized protein n=1 Tax=Penicillium verrucosum TaxID=60171 RepID=UPI002545951B|nr:uncharacterized protein N7516_006578 [Penicillium verrucosum]KAJ5932089.1 hypothetical protein N7516_006578 [Penicillium verrucosum]
MYVGDEHGVQRRFQEKVGEIKTPSFAFADSKCGVPRTSDIPNFIIMKEPGDAIVVGEIKFPWVTHHHIARTVAVAGTRPKEGELRNLLGKSPRARSIYSFTYTALGQIANYMDVMNLKYGVLTTYEQTLFLRQTTLESSLVKHFSDTYTSADPQSVTVRQCFWYIGQLALKGARFNGSSHTQGQIMLWTNEGSVPTYR